MVTQRQDSPNAYTGLSGVTNVGAALLRETFFPPLSPVCAQSVVHVLDHAGIPFWEQFVETRDNHARRWCSCKQREQEMRSIYQQSCCLGPWRLRSMVAQIPGAVPASSRTSGGRLDSVIVGTLRWCSNGRRDSTEARQHLDLLSSPHSLPQNCRSHVVLPPSCIL